MLYLAAADPITARMGQDMLPVLNFAEAFARATGERSPETHHATAFPVASQILSLRSVRAAVLRVIGRTVVDGAFIESLKHFIATNTDAILDRPRAERQETA